MRQFLRGGLSGQCCDSSRDPGARANFERLLGIGSLRTTLSFDNLMCKFEDILCILFIPSDVSCNVTNMRVTNMRHQFLENWKFHQDGTYLELFVCQSSMLSRRLKRTHQLDCLMNTRIGHPTIHDYLQIVEQSMNNFQCVADGHPSFLLGRSV